MIPAVLSSTVTEGRRWRVHSPTQTDKMPSTTLTHAHTLSHAFTLTYTGTHKHAHVRVLTHTLVHSCAHVHIYIGSCNT